MGGYMEQSAKTDRRWGWEHNGEVQLYKEPLIHLVKEMPKGPQILVTNTQCALAASQFLRLPFLLPRQLFLGSTQDLLLFAVEMRSF